MSISFPLAPNNSLKKYDLTSPRNSPSPCVRVVADGKGFRIYQVRQPKNRHLVDVRLVNEFPPTQMIADVRVLSPEELIAQKVMSYTHRRGQPKGGTDWRDLAVLLLSFPQLKSEHGP